jgi:aldose 1-epimerase
MIRECAVAALVCTAAAAPAAAQMIDDDPEIREYVLENEAGTRLRFLNYGAIVTGIEVPDREGRRANVVLGYGRESEYRELNHKNLFGAMVGRYAGRIANARFTLDGEEIGLQANDGPNALHGGSPGIERQIWDVEPFRDARGVGATLRLVSPDGDQGFPGELALEVTYILQEDDAIRLEYAAQTTRPTVLNLTNHSYFNLGGAGSGSVEDHLLRIDTSLSVEASEAGIPTGRFAAVEGTPLDFREARRIGERIPAAGYNHSWLLAANDASEPAIRLHDPESGRTLDITTTEPSVHAYTGDYIDGRDRDAEGRPILPRSGIALETQHLADSPNQPHFPSTKLDPGEVYRSVTVWDFGSEKP